MFVTTVWAVLAARLNHDAISRTKESALADQRSLRLQFPSSQSPATLPKSPPLFSTTCPLFFQHEIPNPPAFMRLRTLSHERKNQLSYFQSLPSSLCALWHNSENQLLCFQTRAHDFVEMGGYGSYRLLLPYHLRRAAGPLRTKFFRMARPRFSGAGFSAFSPSSGERLARRLPSWRLAPRISCADRSTTTQ